MFNQHDSPVTGSPSKAPTLVPTFSPNFGADLGEDCTLGSSCCEGADLCLLKTGYCFDYNPNNASCAGYPYCYPEGASGPNPNMLNCSATNECSDNTDCQGLGFNVGCIITRTDYCTNSTCPDNGGTCTEPHP